MAPFLLNAVMNKAATEQHKLAKDQDKKVLQRGLDASKEVLTRKADKEITPEFTLFAYKLKPVLQQALGGDVDAINGYLDFVDKYKTVAANKDDCDSMMQGAYTLVTGLKKSNPETAGFGPAYERFLQVAVAPPFSRTGLCLAYGLVLQNKGDLAGAAAQYKQVPTSDPNYDATRYQLMEVDNDLVNTPTQDTKGRTALVNELAAVALEIKTRYANATTPADRFKAAFATVTAAQLAVNDQHDPKTALTLLEDFEKSVAGVDQESTFVLKALFIRYYAYVALNQPEQVNAALVAIVKKAPGNLGIKLVHDQLIDLDKQFDIAQASDDKDRIDRMRQISHMEAQLSGYLSNWAKDNPDPVNRKAYYSYAVFDAKIKRIAGTLENDPATKEKDLKEALAQYDLLALPAGHDLYVKQLDPKKIGDGLDPSQPDTYVLLGRALTQYELHDYANAQNELSDLLVNKRLGDTTSDAFWEATVKLYDCNYQLFLAKDPVAVKNIDQTKIGLKGLYIINGADGIPAKWRNAFDDLRQRMMPDWTPPPPLGGAAPQSASTK
jgi:hypothetical protein